MGSKNRENKSNLNISDANWLNSLTQSRSTYGDSILRSKIRRLKVNSSHIATLNLQTGNHK